MIKLLLLILSINANSITVISCNDGDTCKVREKDIVYKVRLSGIDAPEKNQVGYLEAKNLLESKVLNKEVVLNCNGVSYNRKTCEMFVGDEDIQKQMIKAGWALEFPKYSKGKYKKAQDYAKSNQLGLWKNATFISPHCYRWTGTPECNLDSKFQP